MDSCPCGSGLGYIACCGRYISGKAKAPTAEALMRSRYSAYVTHAIGYIVDTCVDKDNDSINVEETKRWSEGSSWKGLKILRAEKGGPADDEGLVEFIASYDMDGLAENHHEISSFKKIDGAWLFESGEVVTETITRSAPKVGRNDPCPCGSGKKYKQCCGK
jgi:SEC-C motif-containing protein